MANKMRYAFGPKVELEIKKTGTVAIEAGDILKRVGSYGRVMAIATTTDATAVIGVAMHASPATDPTATVIRVLTSGHGTVFLFNLAAATAKYYVGQAFKLTSASPQTLTAYGSAGTNPWSSASNVVARCAKEMAASGSTCYVTLLGHKWNRHIVRGKAYTSTVYA